MLHLTMTNGDVIVVDESETTLDHKIREAHAGYGRTKLMRVVTDGTLTLVNPDHIVSAVEDDR